MRSAPSVQSQTPASNRAAGPSSSCFSVVQEGRVVNNPIRGWAGLPGGRGEDIYPRRTRRGTKKGEGRREARSGEGRGGVKEDRKNKTAGTGVPAAVCYVNWVSGTGPATENRFEVERGISTALRTAGRSAEPWSQPAGWSEIRIAFVGSAWSLSAWVCANVVDGYYFTMRKVMPYSAVGHIKVM